MKWLVITPISFSIIMGLYDFLIRRNNFLRFLFGMKLLTAKPAPQPSEARLAR